MTLISDKEYRLKTQAFYAEVARRHPGVDIPVVAVMDQQGNTAIVGMLSWNNVLREHDLHIYAANGGYWCPYDQLGADPNAVQALIPTVKEMAKKGGR